jgi:hypothetical protein
MTWRWVIEVGYESKILQTVYNNSYTWSPFTSQTGPKVTERYFPVVEAR